jgi:photosystem II stability/assembly factor-like uncharacterized protein
LLRLYSAATNGVGTVEDGRTRISLEGRGARCLAVAPGAPDVLYAGTTDEGVYRSEDAGESWDRAGGLVYERVTSLAISPVDGAVYAGTEPSSIFVSRDGGASWRELERMKELPSATTWSFPPRPWTSHVRALAPSQADPGLLLAGIELGGILRSTDGGASWQDQRPGAYADCHSLATHPAAPETFYEAGGGGFAESRDSGESWTAADRGMTLRYAWALAVDAADPALVYVSAASGPAAAHGPGHSGAAIYHRTSGSWKPVLEGLAEFPYALAADPETPGALYAGFGDGTILHSPDRGESWREYARVPGCEALVAVSV